MSDEPIVPTPAADPDASSEPEPPGQLPRGRSGVGLSDVSLVALVFVATLLLLLGATRLVERGRVEPGPTSHGGIGAIPTAGPSAASSGSPAAGPSTSPVTGTPGTPGTPDTSGTPAAPPTGDPVLVGAGDI